MKTWIMTIKGMKCQGCVNSVKEILGAIPGVRKVEVDLQKQEATVHCDESVGKSQLVENINNQSSFKAS